MTDKPGEIVLDAIAVYRLVRLLQKDTLPPLPALRGKLMDRHGAHPLSELIDCPWCLSPYVYVLLRCARRLAPKLTDFAVRALVASAFTGVASTVVERLAEPAAPPVLLAQRSDDK